MTSCNENLIDKVSIPYRTGFFFFFLNYIITSFSYSNIKCHTILDCSECQLQDKQLKKNPARKVCKSKTLDVREKMNKTKVA